LLRDVEGNCTSDVLTSARPRHDHGRSARDFSWLASSSNRV
jgi:hypothetical protein